MLRPITNLIFLFCLIFWSGSVSIAKDWRGIKPIHSTRQDVIRAFGQCKDSNPSCQFSYENEFVHIEFADDGQTRCNGTTQPEMVLLVEVFPNEPVSLKGLGLKRRDFRAVKLDRDTEALVDEVNGLVLKLRGGKILQIDHIASSKDKLICPSYYDSPEEFARDVFRSHVPVINISCPSSVRAGESLTFIAEVAGSPRISFSWRLSVGEIKSGQGTRTVIVDTSGLEGKTIVATATLGRVEASCAAQVAPVKPQGLQE